MKSIQQCGYDAGNAINVEELGISIYHGLIVITVVLFFVALIKKINHGSARRQALSGPCST